MAAENPIDAKEAAKMLSVTPRTVIRLVGRGEIKGFKVGDVWRFHRKAWFKVSLNQCDSLNR